MKNECAKVTCCGKRRGIFPGGILVCPVCDHVDSSTILPNEDQVQDVPPGRHWWPVGGRVA